MADLRSLTSGQNGALVIFAFLQADCRNSEYSQELRSLGQEINLTRDIKCKGLRKDPLDDGDLETDGHLPRCITASLDHFQPSVELQRPGESLQQGLYSESKIPLYHSPKGPNVRALTFTSDKLFSAKQLVTLSESRK